MGESLTVDERRTMLGLLEYPNPLGVDRTEARWRDFSRVELGLRDIRIRQLEDQCAVLAAEVDRQRLVMDATTMVLEYQYRVSDSFAWRAVDDLRLALLAYQASKPK